MKKKIALVTGGTGGLGTAICQALHHDGYVVAAGYSKGGNHDLALQWQQEQKNQGYDIAIIYGDVSQYESTRQMILELEQQLGSIDILVNNAGITRDASFRKMTFHQWMDVINTNLNSVFNVTHHVINGMCDRGFGRIINISSINGQKGQFGQANYSAAKAGVHGFTMALAQEVAKKGVTVNTVSPGYIDTKMLADVPAQVIDSIVANVPVGRLGLPHDIARVVAFLAHEDNQYITGANISANGGQYMS